MHTSEREVRTSRSPRSPWGGLVAVVVGVMMVTLDGTVVSVANPAISADLSPSFGELQWVTHGYLLALTSGLIIAGKMGDRFGHRRIYLIGVIGFAVTSVLIGLSPTILAAILLRVLQGLFGAALVPCALGLVRTLFPEHLLNRAVGVFSAAIGASTAAGPVVGGLLVSAFGWRSVFFLNVPVGIVACVLLVWLLAPNRPTDPESRADLVGGFLLALSMFGLVGGVVMAQSSGWSSAPAVSALLGGVLFVAAFVHRQLRMSSPLVPMALFRSPKLSVGVGLVVLFALAMFGSIFFLTFFLQNVRGASPVGTGLQLLPLSALLATVPLVAGGLIDRYGIRVPVVAGLGAAALGMVLLSTVDESGGVIGMLVGLGVLGVGLGVVNMGATAAIIGSAPARYAGVASGIQSSALHLGGSLGPAVLGAVVSASVDQHLPSAFAGFGAGDLAEDPSLRSSVSQGTATVPDGIAPELAASLTRASHDVFVGGLSTALLVAAGVTVIAAVIAAIFLREADSTALQ